MILTKRAALIAGLTAMALLAPTPWTGAVRAQTPTTPPAQDPVADAADMTNEVELTRAAIQVRRQAIVTAVMDFDSKEAEAFWPLYREYRMEMAKLGDRYVKILNEYLDSHENLSDETAKRILNEYLSIDRARNSLKSKYVGRFSKVMPVKKVARFFQIDNKMDAVINAELAQTVPLAR